MKSRVMTQLVIAKIAKDLLDKRVIEVSIAQEKHDEMVANAVYNARFTESDIKTLTEAPVGWFPEERGIYARFNGSMTVFTFGVNHDDEGRITTRKEKRFLFRDSENNSYYRSKIVCEELLSKEVNKKLLNSQKKITTELNDIHNTITEIIGTLTGLKTTKRVQSEWPEMYETVLKYYGDNTVYLPAKNLDMLTKKVFG